MKFKLTLFDNNGNLYFYISDEGHPLLDINPLFKIHKSYIKYGYNDRMPNIDIKTCGHLCQRWTYVERDTLCCKCEDMEEDAVRTICNVCRER